MCSGLCVYLQSALHVKPASLHLSKVTLLPTSIPGLTSQDSFKCAESGCNLTLWAASTAPSETAHGSLLCPFQPSPSPAQGCLGIAGHSLRGPESLSQQQGQGGWRPSLGLWLLRASQSRCPLFHLSSTSVQMPRPVWKLLGQSLGL